ncbi:MAG: sigma-54-dependent Fis family transcriptional regulator [Flavobacteriales bacterium]|nr:sigma-54-dependent Fis family transcriptional regulator [Flavobacteriales bacterium]
MKRILIIDDNNEICSLLANYLQRQQYETDEAYTGKSALKLMEKNKYALVFCDYRLPDFDGIDLLPELKKIQPDTPVVIMTAYADVRTSIRCIKMGALDYITKPIHHQEMFNLVKEAIANKTTSVDPSPTKRGKKASEKEYVWGNSAQSQRLLKNIELIAPTDMTVIVLGESGTGKEYVANSIHEKSNRNAKPFVAVDCGSLTEELAGSELFGHVKGAFTGALQDKTGQFEHAKGGTLFLDEIGNLSYENQIKLLRVLQERKVRKVGGDKDINIDVRLVVATNEDLQAAVANGKFREDLYHRLNEFTIQLEPLRNRKDDIHHYVEHFLIHANEQLNKNVKGVDDITYDKLRNYYWHGNIRELKNVIKRAVLLANSDTISVENIPTEIVFGSSTNGLKAMTEQKEVTDLRSVVEQAEKAAIIQVLERTNFNKTETAKQLNVDRKTLYNKMNQYGLM